MRRLRSVAIAVVIAAVIGLGAGYDLTGSRLTPIAVYAAFVSAIGVIYLKWLPSIIARRLAQERVDDPTAESRQRRNRIKGILGFTLGAVTGGVALIAGLWLRASSGH